MHNFADGDAESASPPASVVYVSDDGTLQSRPVVR